MSGDCETSTSAAKPASAAGSAVTRRTSKSDCARRDPDGGANAGSTDCGKLVMLVLPFGPLARAMTVSASRSRTWCDMASSACADRKPGKRIPYRAVVPNAADSRNRSIDVLALSRSSELLSTDRAPRIGPFGVVAVPRRRRIKGKPARMLPAGFTTPLPIAQVTTYRRWFVASVAELSKVPEPGSPGDLIGLALYSYSLRYPGQLGESTASSQVWNGPQLPFVKYFRTFHLRDAVFDPAGHGSTNAATFRRTSASSTIT